MPKKESGKAKIIKVRVSELELEAMKKKAFSLQLTVSQMIRDTLRLPIRKVNQPSLKLLWEINKIGLNLNQIARKVNHNSLVDEAVFVALQTIKKSLEQIHGH